MVESARLLLLGNFSMKNTAHIIHTRWLITCEENNKILENHALVLMDGKIHAILSSKEATAQYPNTAAEHYNHHAILPGFINSHSHVPMNVFRGLADDLELLDWLNHHIWPAEGKWLSHELVYDSSLLAMGEMIRGGTTCFNDMYFFMGAIAGAAKLAGIRAHIGMNIIDVPTAWSSSPDEDFRKALEFYEQYKNDALIKPTIAPHSTYMVAAENLLRCKEIADQYKLKMNIHLQESAGEIQQSIARYQKRPLQRLYDLGLVTPDLIAIHMTQLDERDFEILQATKPSLIHCPESNMKLASGICPTEKLRQQGINVALGTDGAASNNDLDMISEMRSATFLSKISTLDPKALPAETVLKMATINGAKALGIEHITGSLEAGKSADFIAIDMEQLETQPLYHPLSQIVYAASRQQVTDVWVRGMQLLKNRQLTSLDEKELLNKAHFWREKIKN